MANNRIREERARTISRDEKIGRDPQDKCQRTDYSARQRSRRAKSQLTWPTDYADYRQNHDAQGCNPGGVERNRFSNGEKEKKNDERRNVLNRTLLYLGDSDLSFQMLPATQPI
jgi:hypothetical protein